MKEFDLEQSIMDCWHVVDDLKILSEKIESLDHEQMKNILIGMQSLYQLKFEKLFELYEEVIFPTNISNDLPPDPLFDAEWPHSNNIKL